VSGIARVIASAHRTQQHSAREFFRLRLTVEPIARFVPKQKWLQLYRSPIEVFGRTCRICQKSK
jgi:hypothetical protein